MSTPSGKNDPRMHALTAVLDQGATEEGLELAMESPDSEGAHRFLWENRAGKERERAEAELNRDGSVYVLILTPRGPFHRYLDALRESFLSRHLDVAAGDTSSVLGPEERLRRLRALRGLEGMAEALEEIVRERDEGANANG